MKKHKAKLKNNGNGGNFKNLGFLIVIFIFSFFIFNLKDVEASFTISRPPTLNTGLVGYWTFDGPNVVNGVANDISGNGNNGNLKNIATSTFYAVGKIGQGFNFDGVNDYVDLGDPASLQLTGAMTISAWVKFDTVNTVDDIFSREKNATDYGYRLTKEADGLAGCNVATNATSGVIVSAITPFSAAVWYHVVCIYTPSTSLALFINGVQDNINTTSIPASQRVSTVGPDIGTRNNGTGIAMDGTIDDVRVYNRALSAGEVKNLYNQGVSKFNKTPTNTLTNGLVGYWTFDGKNVVSGVALDSSGNGNNGNLINIATSTFYSIGKIGQGFNFDGVNDRVDLGTPRIGNETAFTISMWSKISSTQRGKIYSERGALNVWNYLSINENVAGDIEWGMSDDTAGAGGAYLSPGAINLNNGQWHHIVAVQRSKSDRELYIDNVSKVTDTTLLGTFTLTASNIGSNGSSNFFTGLIDDVRIYNRALSAGEVEALYNQGVSKFNKTPTNTLTSGLVGYWTFDGGKVVGGVALDSSGNGNNGNLINIATSTFYAAGKIGQGFNFDGSNDYVQATGLMGNPVNVTLSAWANLSQADSAGSDLVSIGNYVVIRLDNYGTTNGIYYSGAWNTTGISANYAGTGWHHFVFTIDDTNNAQAFYIDGVLKNSTSFTPSIQYSGQGSNTVIGKAGDGSTTSLDFKGTIDDVRVYNRALSAVEVNMLYNMGR